MDKFKFVEISGNSNPLDRETWNVLMTNRLLAQSGRSVPHEEWTADCSSRLKQDEWLEMYTSALKEGNKHREAYRDMSPFAIPRPPKREPA